MHSDYLVGCYLAYKGEMLKIGLKLSKIVMRQNILHRVAIYERPYETATLRKVTIKYFRVKLII